MSRRSSVRVTSSTWVTAEYETVSTEPKFAIGVVAQLCDIHPQTLRHYERLGLVEPRRTPGNFRLYSEADIAQLRRIQRLVDDLGVNLAAVEVILHMREQILQLRRELDALQRR